MSHKNKSEQKVKSDTAAMVVSDSTPEIKPEIKTKNYKIAPGKCITSKRGLLVAGIEVTASDFPGGEDTLKSLFERKLIIK